MSLSRPLLSLSRRSLTLTPRLTFSTFQSLSLSNEDPFAPRPSPPKLDDPKEQAIFEDLISRSTGSFSSSIDERASAITHARETLQEATGGEIEEEERHPDAPKKATPEFEGEKNPRTGEVGGPKVEPLKWGGEGEWTYNGRATDF